MSNSENSCLFGKWALALFVGGVLGTIVVATLFLPLAAVFLVVSLLLTLAFGIAGWRHTTGKVAVIGALVCMVTPIVIRSVMWRIDRGPTQAAKSKKEFFPAEERALVATRPAPAAPNPGDVDTADLGGGVKMDLVWVPAGDFQMGSTPSEQDWAVSQGAKREWVEPEGPVHTVELDGFWMGKTEVTQERYEAVMGKNPSNFKGARNPVEQVSWNDATDFCRKLTDKVGRASSPAKSFRLPAEAEWEYACRAGSSTRFCFGDSDNGLDEYAWYTANSGSKTHPVGEKKANEWVCMTCTGMFGSGAGTGMATTLRAP